MNSFLVFGLVRMDYAALLFVVGIVCTAIGQIGINYLVKKYKRSSLIILRLVLNIDNLHWLYPVIAQSLKACFRFPNIGIDYTFNTIVAFTRHQRSRLRY
jgi:drug/metabolite transporter (DMT)-like permease